MTPEQQAAAPEATRQGRLSQVITQLCLSPGTHDSTHPEQSTLWCC